VRNALGFALALGLAAPAQAACPADRIDIRVEPDRIVAFSVEIADTPEERSRGLMHRTDLARDAGMLFLFETPRPVTFWMKDTPLSLDMIFIAPDGRVCGLIENATPFTLDPRPSGCVTRAVLEVHGGTARALGVGVGDAVRHPAFGRDAAWACAVD
jgi:uncharacterized membrane protein (UPF0127 family)